MEKTLMSASYRSTMDHTMQVTNEWVHQLDELVPWDDSNKSFRLLRATLQTVRDLLGVEETSQFAAQLPLFLRGVFYDGWDPSRTPSALREKPDVIASIVDAMSPDMLDDPEAAVNAVLSLLNTRISPGEINDIRNSMRKSVRDLWPEPHR
jgi:uncharacterized protein (DUF2267 family)